MTKKKYFYGIVVCTAVVIISALVIWILTLVNAPRAMEQLTTEMFTVSDSTIGVDITVMHDEKATRLLGSMSILESQNSAKLYTQVINTDASEEVDLNEDADFVLNNDTLYIKTSTLKTLVQQIHSFDFSAVNDFQNEYTSLYLPSYQLPTFDGKELPTWYSSFQEGIDAFSEDLKENVDLPKTAYSHGTYTVYLNTDELASMVKEIAEIGTYNAAQYYLSIQGVRFNYFVAMKNSPVYFGSELSEYVEQKYLDMPESLLDGRDFMIQQIKQLGDELSQEIIDSNASLTYSIQEEDGTYTMRLQLKSDKDNFNIIVTKRPSEPEISIPANSEDLEVCLFNALPDGITVDAPKTEQNKAQINSNDSTNSNPS